MDGEPTGSLCELVFGSDLCIHGSWLYTYSSRCHEGIQGEDIRNKSDASDTGYNGHCKEYELVQYYRRIEQYLEYPQQA